MVTDLFYEKYKDKKIDVVVGLDSRGFIIGPPLAMRLGVGFVMVRKAGKLPGKTIKYSYEKEYGKDTFEIQEDALEKGQNVLIIDDLIATGGTFQAAGKLVEQLGGNVVDCACIVELPDLKGREKVSYPVSALIEFDGE